MFLNFIFLINNCSMHSSEFNWRFNRPEHLQTFSSWFPSVWSKIYWDSFCIWFEVIIFWSCIPRENRVLLVVKSFLRISKTPPFFNIIQCSITTVIVEETVGITHQREWSSFKHIHTRSSVSRHNKFCHLKHNPGSFRSLNHCQPLIGTPASKMLFWINC